MSRWWGLVGAAVLVVLAVPLIWAARTFLWFGPSPVNLNYPAELHKAAAEANGLREGQTGSWELYERIMGAVLEAEEAASGQEVVQSDGTIRLALSYPLLLEDPGGTSEEARLARKGLEALAARSVDGMLDELAENPAAVRPEGVRGRLLLAQMPDMQAARQLIRALGVQFVEAYRAGDEREAVRVLRRGLAMSRVAGHQLSVLERLIGIACASHMLDRVREECTARPPRVETAVAILEIIRKPLLPPLEATLRGEQLIGLDMISAQFGDSPIRPLSRGAQMQRLNEFYEAAREYAKSPAGQRDREAAEVMNRISERDRLYPAVGMLVPAVAKFIESDDVFVTMRAGTEAMLALEALAHTRGEYPADLGALIPEYLPVPPVDVISGQAFVYRRLERPDEHGRRYLLYSVGLDRRDDGGRNPEAGAAVALGKKTSGFDAVMNEPRPEPEQ